MSHNLKLFIAFCITAALALTLGYVGITTKTSIALIACGYLLHETKGFVVDLIKGLR